MKAYSLDLRQRIVDAYKRQEGSQRELARRFKVSLEFVRSLLKRQRDDQTIEAKQPTGGFAPKLAQSLEVVQQLVEENNDATLEELRVLVQQKTGVVVSVPTICRTLQQLGLTRKKKHYTRLKPRRIGFKNSGETIGKRCERLIRSIWFLLMKPESI
jgi:transposase